MADTPGDSQIRRLVVEQRLATGEEVRVAAEQQRKLASRGSPRSLSEVLVELGFLTRTQANRLLDGNEDSGGRPAQ